MTPNNDTGRHLEEPGARSPRCTWLRQLLGGPFLMVLGLLLLVWQNILQDGQLSLQKNQWAYTHTTHLLEILYRTASEEGSSARLKEEALRAFLLLERDIGHRPSLRGANLPGVHLVNADLSGLDLSYVDLRRSNLYGASLRQTNLTNAFLDGATMNGADLSGARCAGATFETTSFRGNKWLDAICPDGSRVNGSTVTTCEASLMPKLAHKACYGRDVDCGADEVCEKGICVLWKR